MIVTCGDYNSDDVDKKTLCLRSSNLCRQRGSTGVESTSYWMSSAIKTLLMIFILPSFYHYIIIITGAI